MVRACVRTLRLPSSETNEHTRTEKKKKNSRQHEGKGKRPKKEKSYDSVSKLCEHKKKKSTKEKHRVLSQPPGGCRGVKAIVAFFFFPFPLMDNSIIKTWAET